MRYDKLVRNRKATNKLGQAAASASATPAPGAAVLEFSIHNSEQPIGETSKPSRRKGKAKGKSKATSQPEAVEGAQTDDHAASGITDPKASTSGVTLQANEASAQASSANEVAQTVPPKAKPRPKPRPRTAKKPTAPVDPPPTPTAAPLEREGEPLTDAVMSVEAVEETAKASRQVPVISLNAKRGRKRKVPVLDSDSANQQVDIAKPPQKKAKTRNGGNASALAKRPQPVLSTSVAEANMNMGLDEGERDAGDETGIQSQPPPLDTMQPGTLVPPESSERMDVDKSEGVPEQVNAAATPKPRKRGSGRKATSGAVKSTLETSPATRRSARLRKQ